MRLLFFTYLFFAIQSLTAQDSRDFYGSNTYFEINTLNDSIYNLSTSRDVLLDTKTQVLSMSINDSVLHFKNQLNKLDKEAFTQKTYYIRLKTNGYHFECIDKPGYLYAIDNLKLKDIIGSKISIKASYKVFRVKKKKLKLVSVEDVIIKINKDDLNGVLFGIKYTYNPKDNLKKAKIKDAVKFVAVAGASLFALRTIVKYRAVLFPSLF
jgi:hypothetical protein